MRPSAAALALLLATACAHRAEPAVSPAPAASVVRDTVPTPAPRTGPLPAAGDTVVREYHGAFSSGYELSWFQPCDAPFDDALWWVTLTEAARLQRDSLLKLFPVRPTKGLAVVWRGTVSPRMAMGAGHMGRGTRYMLVTRILSLRALDDDGRGACGLAGRAG